MRRGLRALLVPVVLAALFTLGAAAPVRGQEEKPVQRASVPLSFLPPPLEGATYSLGIYDAKTGKLVRHLHEIAPESAFSAGLNGLITKWDGQNDNGEPVLPGRYTARGYAVGPLQVEGTDILANDWARADPSLRIQKIESIELDPTGDHLIVFAKMAGNLAEALELDGRDGSVFKINALQPGEHAPSLPKTAPGKDHSLWRITPDAVLIQEAADGSVLRKLSVVAGDPAPLGVVASTVEDRLYLLEDRPGWQRVRGLSWLETKEEDGKLVSTWQTLFERNIRLPDPALGLETPLAPVEISLVENPLDPGKPQKVKLSAAFDDKGSYLTTADGLRLRQISQRANLKAAKLAKGKTANSLTFFETDGAAWDEFSIGGVRNMMAFDAGEFEMTATGEKPVTEKAAEPPDL